MDPQVIHDAFRAHFGGSPILVRSPGRINLLGEHVDYNDGFVLPAAIDKEIVLAVAPADSRTCTIYAADFKESVEFDFDAIRKAEKSWPNYFLGVLDELGKKGSDIGPVNCLFGGDIPIGGGLSSSAAIECGFAFALNELFDQKLSKHQLVRTGHDAERNFVGVQCGIMDQFANIFGEKGRVVKLDCRSLEYKLIPFASTDVKMLLLDTQISHDLAASEYNLRRQQCEAGLRAIRQIGSKIVSLRDVSAELLMQSKSHLDPVVFRRCHYVVHEMARVLQACVNLERNELAEFGKLMFTTHAGLRDDYEVSCPELDFLVESARDHEGVLGARLMGAGFGGCTINLVEQSREHTFVEFIQKRYQSRFGTELKAYSTRIESGTSRIF